MAQGASETFFSKPGTLRQRLAERVKSVSDRARFPLIAIAGLSLLAALWGGLARLGWDLPQPNVALPANHGPLLIIGFLGTLIGLERAVALKHPWSYGAALFSAMAGLALLTGAPLAISHFSAAVAGLFLVTIFIFLYYQRQELFVATMGFGALLWFGGILLWSLGHPLSRVVPWWVGFLVLTIAGERLELSRLMRLPNWVQVKFVLSVGLFVFGLLISLALFERGVWVSGLGLVALAFWLLRYDLAWRTVQRAGLPRFMAICLLSGYAWLLLGGFLWVLFPDGFAAGFYYDAMLHSIFLGFVFSMIFAHAPIIFPSITGCQMPFQAAFYGHLSLLQASLMLRVVSGLAMWLPGQQWAGLLNAFAILLFLANNIWAIKRGHSLG